MAKTTHPGITDRRIGADGKPTNYQGDKPYRARHRDDTRKEECQSFRTIKEAKAWLAKVSVDKDSGTYVSARAGNVTFAERFKTWFATTTNLRPSTRARDEQYFKTLIEPTLGTLKLKDINHDVLQAWQAKLIVDGKAPATVVRAHQIVAKVLRSAVKAKLIPTNPADDTELPKVEREEQRFLEPAQVGLLADQIDPRYKALVLLGGWGGLRIGEILALRRADIDFDAGVVKVRKTLIEVKGQFVENAPKTKAGNRDVPLTPQVREALREHLDEQKVSKPDYVFQAPQGGPVRVSLFRRRFWSPAVKAAGVAPLRIHDLRHTAVTTWLRTGVRPEVVARWAGHSSVSVVIDRYGHAIKKDDDAFIKKLDAVSREASKAPLASVTAIG